MSDLDIKEIKTDVKELLQRSAVHNELLRTHEARSLALQRSQDNMDLRIKPIEVHVHFVNIALKTIGVITSGSVIGLIVQSIMHHLLR